MTDNQILIQAALRNEGNFPIAVSNVAAKKTARTYTKAQQYDLDRKTCQNQIGVIINLSQELNTLMWDKLNHGASPRKVEDIYLDICILNALSGISIDAAKKEFNVNSTAETKLLKTKYQRSNGGRQVKPGFFAAKDKGKGYYDPAHKDYVAHDTTMDYLQAEITAFRARSGRERREFLPFWELVASGDYNPRNVWKPKAERVLGLIRDMRADMKRIYSVDGYEPEERARLAAERRQDGIEYIGGLTMTRNTMLYLLRGIEQERNRDVRMTIFNTLFGYPNQNFFTLLRQTGQPVASLEPAEDGEIRLFDMGFCAKPA